MVLPEDLEEAAAVVLEAEALVVASAEAALAAVAPEEAGNV